MPHHTGLRLFLFFMLYLAGVALYWLKRADYAVRNPATALKTKHEWLDYYAAPLAYRTAFEIAAFWAWAQYPELFFGYVNNAWGTHIALPMNTFTALCAGLLVDSVMDWAADLFARKYPALAFLTKEVPVIPAVKEVIAMEAVMNPKTTDKASEKQDTQPGLSPTPPVGPGGGG